jgi:hypothetical protein
MNFFVKLFLFFLIIGVFAGYLVFQLKNNLKSSVIEILEPRGADFKNSGIVFKGRARNISFLEINGRPILFQASGDFEESLLLSEGLNNIEIKGRNKFGKEIVKKMIFNVGN